MERRDVVRSETKPGVLRDVVKIRCEGGQPTCKTCEVYNAECRYDKAPPISQVMALVKRLEEAERTIAELRSGQSTVASQCGSPSENSPIHTESSPQPPPAMSSDIPPAPAPIGGAMSATTPATGLPILLEQDLLRPTPDSGDRHTPHAAAKEPVATELSVDEHGKINYYGPTSAVHEPLHIDSPASQESAASVRASARAEIRASLAAHARETATWEEFALGNASLQTGIPRQLMARLLHIHWNWISPMFMWVYKPAFISTAFPIHMLSSGPPHSYRIC